MIVEAQYRDGGRWYAFGAPDGTEIGDILMDGLQTLEVMAIGSDYRGPVRFLERL